MTKTKWDATEARHKDVLVLQSLWPTKNGKPIAVQWNEDDEMQTCYPEYIPSGKPWRAHSIDAQPVPYFTSDRNTCALVLNEIERRDRSEQLLSILIVDSPLQTNMDEWAFIWYGMRIDPDTICYAAIKAVEEEE